MRMDDAYLNVVDQYLPTMTVSADPPHCLQLFIVQNMRNKPTGSLTLLALIVGLYACNIDIGDARV